MGVNVFWDLVSEVCWQSQLAGNITFVQQLIRSFEKLDFPMANIWNRSALKKVLMIAYLFPHIGDGSVQRTMSGVINIKMLDLIQRLNYLQVSILIK